MNEKFCQIQLTLDAIKIVSCPSVFNLTTPLQLFQCSEVKDYSYFKMRYDMPSQMISMIKKRGVWTSQKEKTTKKQHTYTDNSQMKLWGVLKECYQKKQLARLLIKVKYLNSPWHWEGHRLEYKKKKNLKISNKEFSQLSLKLEKGAKEK